MLGWFRAEADRASFSKRLSLEGSEATSAGSTLIATLRPSRVSRARYTSPMPPAPSGARISYGPKQAPGARDIICCKSGDPTRCRTAWPMDNMPPSLLDLGRRLPPLGPDYGAELKPPREDLEDL